MTGILNHNVIEGIPRMREEKGGFVHLPDPENAGASDETADALGLRNYNTRALCLSRPGDIVQLSAHVKRHWDWIREHYQRVGLSFSTYIIWDDDQAIMKDFPGREPSVFLFGPRAHAARPDERRFDATRRFKHKNDLIMLANRINVKTPQTVCSIDKSEVYDPEVFEYPCVIKISDSVSGLGTKVCFTAFELEEQIKNIRDNVKFQIQEHLAGPFISLQYAIDAHGHARPITSTGQFLDGNSHEGNYSSSGFNRDFPLPREITRLVQAMADRGLRDWVGIDAAVIGGNNGRRQYLPLECNPRHTGAAYPYIISRKLGSDFWAGRAYKTRHRSFSAIDLGELEYDPRSGKGWIVFLWGAIDNGKIGLVYCGPERDYRLYEDRLRGQGIIE